MSTCSTSHLIAGLFVTKRQHVSNEVVEKVLRHGGVRAHRPPTGLKRRPQGTSRTGYEVPAPGGEESGGAVKDIYIYTHTSMIDPLIPLGRINARGIE